MRPSAPERAPERASGRCLRRGRRGPSQPQREWPPRPPVPPTPDVPITARLARAHSAAIIATEGIAITRHSDATHVGRRVLSAASNGESPPFVRRRPAIRRRRAPKTARPLRSIRFPRSVFIRVPRLAQQGDDLAHALLPCQVEGRPAVLGSERRIRASFEETLGDREVALPCRVMES